MTPVEPQRGGATLSDLTTMRVGGAPERLIVARDADEIVARARELWASDEPWLLLGGGSNTVVADDGFPGTVLLIRSSGIERIDDPDVPTGGVRLRVQAGEDWDRLVAECVDRGWAGIEALSGIPGLTGAAPIQNIGAYGAELSQVLHSIEFLDRDDGEVRTMSAADLELAYRDSVIKRGLEGVVLSIDLVLAEGEWRGRHGDGAETPRRVVRSAPIAYRQLADSLGVDLGARVPIADVREAVLRLRASKGMVLDDSDHDTWSAGSFFTNPIVSERFARSLPDEAPRFALSDTASAEPAVTTFEELAAGIPMRLPARAPERRVKLSAAWLIEHAAIPRGYRLPGSGAAISSKHTLAITNRGAATAADVAELARFVVQRVQQEFGVILVPEPNLYGLEI